MKQLLLVFAASVAFSACSKKDHVFNSFPDNPIMYHTDLNNREVKFNQPAGVDVDNDGISDFVFTTWHIGDPVLKRDIIQFHVSSNTSTLLMVGDHNDSPIFQKGATILNGGSNGYDWFEVSLLELAQKIVPERGAPFWQGAWKDVQRQYIAIQVKRNGLLFTGWVQVTFDTSNEKLIIHKAAISTEPFKNVKAGI
jgi:hypothetical protein